MKDMQMKGASPATRDIPASRAVHHVFSVDVEEYFQVAAFEPVVSRSHWSSLPSRLEWAIDRLLDLLAAADATGTFFTLGWIAERQPRLVRRIADAGHEIGSHGWWHRRVSRMQPREFREELRASKAVLEQVSGTEVLGFRAPNFSILPGGEWAFDVLLEEGYTYDSSLFPIRRPGYGYPGAPPIPHLLHRPAGTLCELPLTTTKWRGVRIPTAGGAYFRHFPYAVTRHALRQLEKEGLPGVFYIHPWELDPDQPRLVVPMLTRVRHYGGLSRTHRRLQRLLAEFRFSSARELLDSIQARGGNLSTHRTASAVLR